MTVSKVDKKKTKTGGRKKGTPNKKTIEFIEALKGFDPVVELTKLYKNTKDDGIKLGVLKEMLKYIYPQRKAVEMSKVETENNEPIEVKILKQGGE